MTTGMILWGSLSLFGLLLVIMGLIYIPLFVIGLIVFSVGIKFFIHYWYKHKTGQDTRGMKFWKWIWSR